MEIEQTTAIPAELKRITTIFLIIYGITFAFGLQMLIRQKSQIPDVLPKDLPNPLRTTYAKLLNSSYALEPINYADIYSLLIDKKSPLTRLQRIGCWQKIKQTSGRQMIICRGVIKRIKISGYAEPKLILADDKFGRLLLRFGGEREPDLAKLRVGQTVSCSGFLGNDPGNGLYDCKIEAYQ